MILLVVTYIATGVTLLLLIAAVAILSKHSATIRAWYKSHIPDNIQVLLQSVVVEVEKDLGTAAGSAKFSEAVTRAQAILNGMGIPLPLNAIAAGIELAYRTAVQDGLIVPVVKPEPAPAPAPAPAPPASA